jgi:hypothetical protein
MADRFENGLQYGKMERTPVLGGARFRSMGGSRTEALDTPANTHDQLEN